jgi:hypothetical protein
VNDAIGTSSIREITMSAQVEYDPSKFYVWQATDAFAVHLSLKVVMQLNVLISRVRRDGQLRELCGILLGRTIQTPFRVTVIEDFELVPSDRCTSAHPLSDAESFEIACRRSGGDGDHRPLGFFRAQWDGNLNMGPRDLQAFSEMFCEDGNIALLIRTPLGGRESEAALFYWQHGEPHPRDCGFGFRFDAAHLMSARQGWRFPDPVAQTPPAPMPKKPALPRWTSAASSSTEGIRWSRLLPTAALMTIGIGAIQLFTNSNRTLAADPISDTSLGLTVTSHPHQLEIRWNRKSPAIAASQKGMMRITEAGMTEALPFDQDQLLDGYVAYAPTTNDVSIRLEVTGQDRGTTTESIRAVAVP